MKVFLDDKRDTPSGYIRTYSVEETIAFLDTRQVDTLSLDNDLGDDCPEGYLALDYLEESIYHDPTFPVPQITVHSSNASRVLYMQRAIESINRIVAKQVEEGRRKQ